MNKNIAIRFIILFVFAPYFCYASTCLDWFKESKISANDKTCLSQCTTLQVDMSTFSCRQDCEKFCKPKKCETDLFWKNKIRKGRPKNWEINSEKSDRKSVV